ncbi:hypothetical protein Tco_0883293 [Tanacetum coccineum]
MARSGKDMKMEKPLSFKCYVLDFRTFHLLASAAICKNGGVTTNTPYPSKKIRRIRACTHQRPQKIKDQYAISRRLNSPYSRYGINIIFWKISNVVPTPRNPQYALNVAYPLPLDTAYPDLCPIQRIHPNRLIRLRMAKVIKGEFKKIKDIKVEDDSLACDSPLEVFNCEVSRLSKIDDDLFTNEVEIANIPCNLRVDDDSEHEADDMGFDPSDIAFTEWLGSKFFNYKTMDHYTMKALWIYGIRGDDEVELTDEEFFDNEDEISKIFRIDTNIFDYETPICSAFNEFNYLLKVDPDLLTKDIMGFKTYDDYKDDWIYEWNKDVPWVDEKPWTDTRWCEALEDSELKDEALRSKAIMEGFIKDDDDESSYEQMRRWDIYTNYDDTYKTNHDDNEREELYEVHEPPVCTIQRFEMIKYSFRHGKEYVTIKEDEYDDLTRTSNNACRTYQEIFRMMNEGWMVTRAE